MTDIADEPQVVRRGGLTARRGVAVMAQADEQSPVTIA